MAEQTASVAASIAACTRITSFLTNTMDVRKQALKDVPHQVDGIKTVLVSRYDSLHVVQCAPDEIATLQSILDSLVDLDFEVKRVNSMNMFVYRLQIDRIQARLSLYYQNLTTFIYMWSWIRPFDGDRGGR